MQAKRNEEQQIRSSERKKSHPTQNFILQEFIIKSEC